MYNLLPLDGDCHYWGSFRECCRKYYLNMENMFKKLTIWVGTWEIKYAIKSNTILLCDYFP